MGMTEAAVPSENSKAKIAKEERQSFTYINTSRVIRVYVSKLLRHVDSYLDSDEHENACLTSMATPLFAFSDVSIQEEENVDLVTGEINSC